MSLMSIIKKLKRRTYSVTDVDIYFSLIEVVAGTIIGRIYTVMKNDIIVY
jgi:hypothetical protein